MPDETTPINGASLEEFLNRVGGAIKQEMPGTYWVRAEILSCTQKSYWSLELGSYNNESQKAKVRANIWASNSSAVTQFESKTGVTLKSGLKILFACSVQFHPEFGISLNISEIDPSFTLGDMELRLNFIRKRLQSLGEIDLNKRLPVPNDFTAVAVISPPDAAGLGDFQSQTEIIERYGLCRFKYFTAQFQGSDVANSLVSAMNGVVTEYRAGISYDALIIIRGGGDKAGLFQLNEIRIARGVCRCPIPVMVGIGHDRDSTILDEVAANSFPTPSTVASFIKASVVKNAREALLNYQRLRGATAKVCFSAEQDVQQYKNQIEIQSRRGLEKSKSDVTANRQQLILRGTRSIQQARYDGETTYQSLLGSSYRNFQQASETVRAAQQQLLFHAEVRTNNAKNGVENVYERMMWLSGYCSSSALVKVEAFHMGLVSNANQKILDAKRLLNRNLRDIGTQASQQLLIASNEILREFSMLQRSAERLISLSKGDVTILIEKLLLQDPTRILSRGFVYIQSSSGKVITNKYNLHVGQKISIHMKDGEINAIISGE